MSLGHDLDAVRDVLAAHKGIPHPQVIHRNAVTDSDGIELNGRAARHPDSSFDRRPDFVEFDMAGNDLVEGVCYTDDRLIEVFSGKPHGHPQRPMGSLLDTGFHDVTSHGVSSVTGAPPDSTICAPYL